MCVHAALCDYICLKCALLYMKSVKMKQKKRNEPSVCIMQRDQVDNGTSKQINERKKGDLTMKQRKQHHRRMLLMFNLLSRKKWHNLQLFSDGNFSFCDFAFYCVIHIHTHTRTSHIHTRYSHTCLFIWWTYLNICCAGRVYPFSITPPYEVEIESCC